MSARRSWISTISALILFLGCATYLQADPINLGTLSFGGFIPGAPGAPGTVTVGIDNLTGLPPDFYDNPIDFTNVQASLTFADSMVFGCNIGTVDASGANTDCQVADTTSLSLILLTGNIPTIITADGSFSSFSSSLNPNTDTLAVISVGATGPSPVPEPPSLLLVMSGFAAAFYGRGPRSGLLLSQFPPHKQVEVLNRTR